MVERAPSPTSAGVPFLDLRPIHEPLADDVLEDLGHLLATGHFVNGPQVDEFERAFADFVGRSRCVGVASGLDALRLALLAMDLEPGAEVVVPASTFVATFEAVTQAGLVPVVVDVLEGDYGLDPEAVDAAVGPRTRAVLPVHLYGQMADMRALGEVGKRYALPLVEDAAQAHGAVRDGLRAGAASLAAAFSFYPGKNLGAMGDAGALVTDDERLADRVQALREHGQQGKYVHEWEGYTARLDTVQAIFLLHKLPHLEGWNEQRRRIAGWYTAALEGVGDLRMPRTASGSDPVWHLYVVRTADPEGLGASLRERGIGTGRHYPIPPHLTPAYAHLGHPVGSFPVSETLSRECLSLPIFPGMSEAQAGEVIAALRAHFDRG